MHLCTLVSFSLNQEAPRAGLIPQGKPTACLYADLCQGTVTDSECSYPSKPAVASDNSW